MSRDPTWRYWIPQKFPCETKIFRKRKFCCLNSIFNFFFNYKCNLVSIISKYYYNITFSVDTDVNWTSYVRSICVLCLRGLALKIFEACFRPGQFRGNHANCGIRGNSFLSQTKRSRLIIISVHGIKPYL